ncbi:tetratricopeptide repeat protein [Alteromonas stellipolaris]|uniref:tetratricopeptide repeat protein n=1 Tax=Alteromonas stellipolaris TaxID=233316 RepID=UPI0026E2696B|nr:tetratricopeptide repeat protein [Alteromonas stellipolaris]MDO6535200.1 tetratricopeptide repeat protein [Alteromonas stellipolaris]MDO6538562.1 tetratricopeptide repeat protein [Alteromonas stellipolaris]MDO6626890.1 tetratricopeptide repeat protein [Alteromonas stellipolaris]
MSVVNKMLKDLEAREGVEQPQARYEAPQKKPVSALTVVVVLLVIVTIALVTWVLLNPAPSVSSSVISSESPSVSPTVLASESRPNTDTDEVASSEQSSAVLAASLPASLSTPSNASAQPSTESRVVQNDDMDAQQILSTTVQTSAPVAPVTLSETAKNIEGKEDKEGEPQKSPSSVAATNANPNPITSPDINATGIAEAQTTSKSVDRLKTVESAPVPSFSKQVDNTRSAPAIEEQVRLALDNNDYNTAIGLMQQKVQSHPSDSGAKKKLASLLFASGQIDQAQALLQRMLVNTPDDHSVRLMLSRLYVKQGLTKIAIQNASEAVSSPSNPLTIELLSFRANLLQQHSVFDKSLNDYLALTKRRPLEPKWWLGAAISADSLQHSALALSAFSQVIQIDTQQTLSPDVHHYVQERIARLREVVNE